MIWNDEFSGSPLELFAGLESFESAGGPAHSRTLSRAKITASSFPPPRVREHGDDDDDAGDVAFVGVGGTELDEAGRQGGDDEDSEKTFHHAAASAHQTGAADDHRSDGAEFKADTGVRIGAAEARAVKHGRQTGQRAEQCVCEDARAVHRYAGYVRGLAVRADGDEMTAQRGVREQHLPRDDDEHAHDERRRDDEAAKRRAERLDGRADVFRLRLGELVGHAAHHFEHAERNDEGRQSKLHAHESRAASEQATKQHTARQRGEKAELQVHHARADDRAAKTEQRADRQIDPAGDHDQRHARRDERERRNAVRDIAERREATKRVPQQPEQHDHRREDSEEDEVVGEAAHG